MKLLATAGAVVVVVGYFGFEVFNLYRLQYRMEPLYIFDQFASAHVAIKHCGTPDNEERLRFSRNFDFVTGQAIEDIVETADTETAQPISMPEAAEAVSKRLELKQQEVEELLASQGCEGPDLRRLVKFHEIRARLNVGKKTST